MANTDTTTEPDDATTSDEEDTAPPEPAAESEDGLGAAGKRALKQEREARKAADRKAADLEQRLADLEAQQLSDSERAIAAARSEGVEQGRQEARDELMPLLLQAETRALGTGKVADDIVDDLPRLLNLDTSTVIADGGVNKDAISEAISELVDSRPTLARREGTNGTATPDPDQGGRAAGRPAQLSDTDLQTMTPREINAARREGRLDDMLSGGR